MVILADLMRDHDTDPTGTAAGLRALAASGVAVAETSRFGWLVNHVIGDKLGDRAEALMLLKPVCTDTAPVGAWRQLAVAACLAGDVMTAWGAEARMGDPQATVSIRLSILERLVETSPPLPVAEALLQCLPQLDPSLPPGPQTSMLAASLNNVVTALLEHKTADFTDPTFASALTTGAAICRNLWQQAGTWLNWERADYLVAMVANHFGDFPAARDAAQSALQLIDAHGPEDIDRAFTLLELARAERGLGSDAGYKAAKDTALAIAADFNEAWLVDWFAQRSAFA